MNKLGVSFPKRERADPYPFASSRDCGVAVAFRSRPVPAAPAAAVGLKRRGALSSFCLSNSICFFPPPVLAPVPFCSLGSGFWGRRPPVPLRPLAVVFPSARGVLLVAFLTRLGAVAAVRPVPPCPLLQHRAPARAPSAAAAWLLLFFLAADQRLSSAPAQVKIASQPSIYMLDTPGVLVPSIPDMETGLKLALTGAVKDSVVGEERIAKYLLSLRNIRKTPLHWERLVHRREEFDEEPGGSCEKGSRDSLWRRRRFNNSDAVYVQDMVMEVQRTLCSTAMEFTGNLDEDNELESLIEAQLVALRKVFRIPHKPLDESHGPASKKLLTLFRSGKLGPFILDDLPGQQ